MAGEPDDDLDRFEAAFRDALDQREDAHDPERLLEAAEPATPPRRRPRPADEPEPTVVDVEALRQLVSDEVRRALTELVPTLVEAVLPEPPPAPGSAPGSELVRLTRELAEILGRDREAVVEAVREVGADRRSDEIIFLLERIERRLARLDDPEGDSDS